MPLTIKQARFVEAYLATPNGKKAAILAGYSEPTAEKAGSRLLRHKGVASEIERRRLGQDAPPKQAQSPLAFLLAVMNDPTNTIAQRIRAAMAAIPYQHAKPAPGGKKDAAEAAAKVAARGRYAPGSPPLALVTKKT